MAEDDSGERTLEPTQKKLDQAIERGDVAKSQELTTWFVLGAGTLGLYLFAPPAARDLTLAWKGLMARAGTLELDGASLLAIARTLTMGAAAALALPLILLLVASAAGNAMQH